MTTTRISNETYSVRPYTWQAYGYYSQNANSLWASAVRASNPFTASLAVLRRTHDLGPVITYLEPLAPRERGTA